MALNNLKKVNKVQIFKKNDLMNHCLWVVGMIITLCLHWEVMGHKGAFIVENPSAFALIKAPNSQAAATIGYDGIDLTIDPSL